MLFYIWIKYKFIFVVPIYRNVMEKTFDFNEVFFIGLLLQCVFSSIFGITELLLFIRLSIINLY